MNHRFDFALVDAFTAAPLTGNPCSVVIGAEELTNTQMLSIAKEMNQSETSFLMKSKTSDIRARYFTPEREIPLAGHPTIATIHAALEFGIIKQKNSKTTITLELQDGPIIVEIEPQEKGPILIRMFQRKPVFGEIHDPNEVLPIFNLSSNDLLAGCKIQTVSTGTKQLMVPVKSQESLKKLQMDIPA